jgi:hypothetical protein
VLGYAALFFVLLMGLHLEAGYVSRRHWLVPVAMLLPFAARGLFDGAHVLGRDRFDNTFRRRLASGVVAIVVFGFVLHAALDREEPVKLARKEAALWLRAAESPLSVSAPRSRLAYYSGAERHVRVPETSDPAEFVRELRAGGAMFLLAETDWVPRALWEGGLGLRPLHRVPYQDGEVLVFRVEEPDVAAGTRNRSRPPAPP